MLFRVSQKDLRSGIRLASRAIPSRLTMPVLDGVLLEAGQDGLQVTSTDLDVAIWTRIPAAVEESGAAVVPAKLLGEIVDSLPDGEVTVRLEKGARVVSISCGRSLFEVDTFPPEDYPRLPGVEGAPAFSVDARTLRRMSRQTVFACGTDASRPFLTGVYITASGHKLRAAATDGSRLALSEAALETDEAAGFSRLIPQKAIRELMHVLSGFSGQAQVVDLGTHVVFTVPDARVFARPIASRFPDYEQVTSREARQVIRVGADALAGALRRASVTAGDSLRGDTVFVRIRAVDNRLVISSEAPQVGRSTEEVEVSSRGEPVEVCFNPHYLIEALSVIEAGEVELGLTGELSPGFLRPATDGGFLYVVAPVQPWGVP